MGREQQVTLLAGGNVIVTRNAEPLSVQPQSTVFVSSVPAITRVGNRLYVVVRATNNNIYCTRSDSPYTSWAAWQYVNGQTLDAPAIAPNAAGNQVWAFVRGTNNILYSANLTNCPASPGWTAAKNSANQFIFLTGAPAAVSDPSGIYVSYADPQAEYHRWKHGTTSFPVARSFGSDQDIVGGMQLAYQYAEGTSPFFGSGYGPVAHKTVWIPPANQIAPLNLGGCAFDTPPR